MARVDKAAAGSVTTARGPAKTTVGAKAAPAAKVASASRQKAAPKPSATAPKGGRPATKPAAKAAAKTPVKAAPKPPARTGTASGKTARPSKPAPAAAKPKAAAPAAPAAATPAASATPAATKAKPIAKAPAKAVAKTQTAAVKAPAAAAKAEPTPAVKPVVKAVPKTPAKAAPAPVRRSGPLDKFLLEQRQLLLDERATHVRQAESLKEEADALAAEMEPGESEFGEEGGEGGNLSIERELDLVLSAQAKGAVDEIDRALLKIVSGSYGLCEKCGREIPRARLKALPHAPLCVACKSGGLSRR